ncbi:EamA family transporter RarD [Palleronia caenipelagi]|uniref:EamA family transporter RarD n=1 Tax=Palleronia caenipelagi TaxID=2489174 RepID=UPI001FE92CC1|nr:EamA family transporter RarD [Palleronia caenipelagi]
MKQNTRDDAPVSARAGVWSMVAACVVWGLSPLFYKALSHVPPVEILAHRTLWSLLLFVLILWGQGRRGEIVALIGRSRRNLALILAAAALITVNWGMFIYAVQAGEVVQSSLGYYIFPLVSVAMGAAIFQERLNFRRKFAVALATAGVVILIVGLGEMPTIALVLALTFGTYGVVKRLLGTGPLVSVAAEVLILAPLALGWLVFATPGLGGFQGWTAFGLMAAGPMTAIPLMLFSRAAKALPMATVGLIQYLNPTLQFLCGVVIFGEAFSMLHAITFAIIWTALGVYSLGAARKSA